MCRWQFDRFIPHTGESISPTWIAFTFSDHVTCEHQSTMRYSLDTSSSARIMGEREEGGEGGREGGGGWRERGGGGGVRRSGEGEG